MEHRSKYKSIQNFAMIAASVGVLLIVTALITGVDVLVFSGGMLSSHAVAYVRSNIDRIVFSFLVPLVGGILLIMAGLKLLNIDELTAQRNMVQSNRKRAIQHKEKILNAFLNDTEKRIMELIREYPDGALQSDLVIKSGFSKVKIHRILKSLENKEIIKRGRFGITNKVFINS
ncbi:MAG: hypothetical protein KGI06_00500 [Candidatus Micrarchaeota archaeon]|nr:hypothetical protein [Candidatus Micrarchaeota archaeon]